MADILVPPAMLVMSIMQNQADIDMLPAPYQGAQFGPYLKQCWLIAHLVDRLPVHAMMKQAQLADTMGAFFDPTRYRDNMDKMQQDRQMLVALSDLQGVLAKMKGARRG